MAQLQEAADTAGYIIRECQSGGMRRKGRITKTGSALVRKLLVQGAQAMCAKRPENLSVYFPSLAQRVDMRDRTHVNKAVRDRRDAISFSSCTFPRVVPETAADLEFEFARQGRDKV